MKSENLNKNQKVNIDLLQVQDTQKEEEIFDQKLTAKIKCFYNNKNYNNS